MIHSKAVDADALYLAIGRRIRSERLKKGLSQSELGAASELTRASIANLEQGRQRIPLHRLYGIATALGTDVSTLLPPTAFAVTDSTSRGRIDSQLISDKLSGLPAAEKRWVTELIKERAGEP